MTATSAIPAVPSSDLGSELRVLVRLAWPIAVAQLGLVSMGLVDTAIVGRVSVADLAGTAMGGAIAFAGATLGMGVATALEPLASQAIGAGSPRRAWGAYTSTLRVCALLGIPTLFALFIAGLCLGPMGIAPEIIPKARDHLLGRAPGILLFIVYLVGKTYLQAHGETRPALVASIAANVMNVVVCSILVRGDDALRWAHIPPMGLPRMGALGAGIATSIASLLLASIVLHAAWKHRPRDGGEPVAMRTVFLLGTPVGLQFLAEIGVFTVVALIAGRLGPAVVSAHQIAIGMASFTFMGALGVSGATAVRVGHAVGAGASPRRVGLLGIGLGAMVMGVGALSFALFPSPLMRVFTDDAAVIATGAQLLGIAALFQLFDGVQVVAAGALRGAGDVRFPFVANVVAHWFVGFPVACLLAFGLHMGARGLWWGLTSGLVSIACALALRFAWITRGVIRRV